MRMENDKSFKNFTKVLSKAGLVDLYVINTLNIIFCKGTIVNSLMSFDETLYRNARL